ncbi:hypothetical protein [Nocardioides soli]|uniref:Uncharacterized protein n=1 Tax=Nocardioides soli TaxID=1036020 RepID=A0A7W4VZG2_9ACTN|nr:hypothetical protein [Nocardioides soli]MBB3044651.1 hypothetical protein [Nocardioides soli]
MASEPDPSGTDDRSRRSRRRAAGIAAAAVAVCAVGAAALANGASAPSGPAEAPPTATAAATPPPLAVPPSGSGGTPPPVVVRGDGPQAEAWQGSYCWGTRCVDMISPPWDELPVLGAVARAEAGFADVGATWSVSLLGERRCAVYPVLLTPTGDGRYDLTPSGPGGEYQVSLFVQPSAGGDTSGAARWTTPGAVAPMSWAHLHQNGPYEGGSGTVQVVLDGAAVDGAVGGTVSVTGSERSETFDLRVGDQGCAGDRYVLLTARGVVDAEVDGLGDGPFRYDVDVVVDGAHHRARAASTAGAEDTPLRFEPAPPR